MCSILHNQVLVAHHEAAHAVVSYILNVEFNDITIECRKDDHEWYGRVNVGKGGPPYCQAKIAVAGCLAEIKLSLIDESKLAPDKYWMDSLRDIRISDASIPSIVKALYALDDDENSTDDNMKAEVELFVGSKMTKHHVFLFESIGDMDIVRKIIGDSINNLGEIVSVTKELIDDQKNWNAILRIAQALLEEKPQTFFRKRLSGNIAAAMIESLNNTQ